MKFELICDNCGGKRFSCRCSSSRLGGWNKDGSRQSSRESLYCNKCGCCIDIIYEQKKETKVTNRRKGK